MRRLLPILLLASCAAAHAGNRSCGGAWDFVPDAPGKVEVDVPRDVAASYYRLTKAESAEFDRRLRGVLDVMLSQPHLRPPRGLDVTGWLRQWRTPRCDARDKPEPCLGVPVAALGDLQYRYFHDIDGKPQTIIEGWKTAVWSVNNIDDAHGGGGGAEVRELGFSLQLAQDGEIDGVPLFKNHATGSAYLVFARSGRPAWTRPVSQQEYLEAAIRRLQAEVAQQAATPGDVPPSDTPAADRLRAWQRDAAARQQEQRKLIEETRRRNPALADTLRRTHEQLEADMVAAMRRDVEIERQKAARAVGRPAPPKAPTLADRLARHRERLAELTPAQRRAQAYFMSADDPLDPALAPPGKEADGYPLTQPNPDYFDPRLPRTALQLLVLRVAIPYTQPIAADECGGINPAEIALSKTIRETPWQRVRALLAP